MKLYFQLTQGRFRSDRKRAATTLIEMMFASAIFTMVIFALMSANWMGMQQDQLVESKGGASDSSRKVLNQLPVDIRSCKMWFVGNLSGTNFTTIVNNTAQQGNALQLFESTNGSQSILYYFTQTNANNGMLWRSVSTNWSPVVIASNLINTLVFYGGELQRQRGHQPGQQHGLQKHRPYASSNSASSSIRSRRLGTNCLYDFYILNFKSTPHLPE